jgi:archaeal preflagellin peptidase FlaK
MGSLLLLLVQIATGAMAVRSDLGEGRIYNKHLVLFGLIGGLIYVAFHGELVDGYADRLAANALASLAISFMLFYGRFWSAGDAKLFCLLAVLTPFSLYPSGLLFPAFYPLMAVFCIAFAYTAAESIYYWAADQRRPDPQRRFVRLMTGNKAAPVDWLLRYLAASLLLGLIYRVAGDAFPLVVGRDRGFAMAGGMILLVLINARLKTRAAVIFAAATGLLANAIYSLFREGDLLTLLDARGPLVALLTLSVTQFIRRYDYRRVPVTGLRPDMILSTLSVAGFKLSPARGLPNTTTEDTRSRLTASEVESIRNWSAAKSGRDQVVIVAHMPFAPFILAGVIAYVVLAYRGVFGG